MTAKNRQKKVEAKRGTRAPLGERALLAGGGSSRTASSAVGASGSTGAFKGKQSAEKIMAECAITFPANSKDCNRFLKAVAAAFFEPDLFAGPNMNADAIVVEMRQSGDWTKLRFSHLDAIRDAKAGLFVVAGMTSSELSSNHGHLAVVVGDEGQNSGDVLVPICYAGSLSPNARVQRKRVSETFGAQPARESRISYFSRKPQIVPSSSVVDRLVDHLRGLSAGPAPVRRRKGSIV